MAQPQLQERTDRRSVEKPRLALALSGGLHGLALLGFLLYHAFPPERPSEVPIFEMVSLEPPKLRPLRPKTLPPPEPPPPEEVRAPEAPKLTPKPEKAVVPKKPEPRVQREPDSTLPARDVPERMEEATTSVTSDIPADPRLSIWGGRVKKLVERYWNPPGGIPSQGEVVADVGFTVDREGNVTEIGLDQGSGVAMIDELAVRAVQRVERLPPIPENFPNDNLRVRFKFKYGSQ